MSAADMELAYLAPLAVATYDPFEDIAEAVMQGLGIADRAGPIQACTRMRAANYRFLDRLTGRPSRVFMASFIAIRDEQPELSAVDVVRSIIGVNIEGAKLRALGQAYLGPLEESTAEVFAAPGNVSNAA